MPYQTYPTRCQIIDAAGHPIAPGVVAATPAVSQPHVGKFGLAEQMEDWSVKITLDDGSILWGYECWWIPIEESPENPDDDNDDWGPPNE